MSSFQWSLSLLHSPVWSFWLYIVGFVLDHFTMSRMFDYGYRGNQQRIFNHFEHRGITYVCSEFCRFLEKF